MPLDLPSIIDYAITHNVWHKSWCLAFYMAVAFFLACLYSYVNVTVTVTVLEIVLHFWHMPNLQKQFTTVTVNCAKNNSQITALTVVR